MKRYLLPVALFLAMAAFAGCGKKDNAAQPEASASLPDGFILKAAPEKPLSVLEAKAAAKDGERITITGRVGGTKRAINDTRALFTIADTTLLACDSMGAGDHCPTPWDYCCEDPDKLKAGLATIKVVGADGKPLAVNLTNALGLKPLQTAVITGIAEIRADDGALVIRADGIFSPESVKPNAARAAEPSGCCPH